MSALQSQPTQPSEAQIQTFIEKLRTYRDTLPEDEQKLLNALFFAAMGQQKQKDEDIHAYWVARGPYGRPGWYGRPWGAAYGYYYPR